MKQSFYKYLVLLIGIFLLIYITARAYLLSFTYDECSTYIFIHEKDYQHLFATANNHLLNSFFVWLLSKLIGNSEIILRSPNIMAYVLFLIYSYQLTNLFKYKWLTVTGFVLLNINPFMLDFFSLSRGYGLALGLMMPSLYYTLKSFGDDYPNIKKRRFCSVLFASLAVLSNLILLNYFLSLFFLFFASDIYSGKISLKKWCQVNLPSILVFFGLFLILFPVIKILIEKKQLYHGGEIGFWQDSIGSLISCSFYFQSCPDSLKEVIEGFILVVFIMGGLLFLLDLVKRRLQYRGIIFLLLLTSVLIPILQFKLLGTLFPVGRTALFYLPLFILLLISIMDKISQTSNFKEVTIGCMTISAFMIIPPVFHFYRTANLHYTHNWEYDADTKFALEDLKKEFGKNEYPLFIGVDWRLGPSTWYYSTRDHNYLLAEPFNIPWYPENINKQTREKSHKVYLLFSFENYPELFQNKKLELVKEYKCSKLQIWKPN